MTRKIDLTNRRGVCIPSDAALAFDAQPLAARHTRSQCHDGALIMPT